MNFKNSINQKIYYLNDKIALILKENKKHNSKVIKYLKSKRIKLDIFIGKNGDKLPLKLRKKI